MSIGKLRCDHCGKEFENHADGSVDISERRYSACSGSGFSGISFWVAGASRSYSINLKGDYCSLDCVIKKIKSFKKRKGEKE